MTFPANPLPHPVRILIFNFLTRTLPALISRDYPSTWQRFYEELGAELGLIGRDIKCPYNTSGHFLSASFKERYELLITHGETSAIIKHLELILTLTHPMKEELLNTYREIGEKVSEMFPGMPNIPNRIDAAEDPFDVCKEYFDDLLQKHGIGKVVNMSIILFNDEIGAREINDASKSLEEYGIEHIEKAARYLSDPNNFDYANCIKESHSAMEAIAKKALQSDKSTLSDCIKKLRSKGELHSQFIGALDQLNHFANDVSGARHGGEINPQHINYSTARFMLVSSSAVVNFLIANLPNKK